MDFYAQEQSVPEWDHRRIGRELDLFSFVEEGPGMPFFHPKGLQIKNHLIQYWRELHQQFDYQEIQSPLLLHQSLWQQSGHWQHFRENMYVSSIEKRIFAIKPMNCPGAILYYQRKRRSYAELPMRICELGQVHRHEPSGSLRGLLRVREFIVDDGHIFCSPQQAQEEIKQVLNMAVAVMHACGFRDYIFELSLRSEEKVDKYLGEEEQWQQAEAVLCAALQSLDFNWRPMPGEAKFYGPAIDVKIKDSVGRQWQCASIQLDFNLPQRFKLAYYDHANGRQQPVLIHRALFGSLERFIGMLLEHHNGKLPFWLAPVQLRILCVEPEFIDYAEEIKDKLLGYSCEIDGRDCHLSNKIKQWQQEKIPLAVIIGKQEKSKRQFALRFLSGEQKKSLPIEGLAELLQRLRVQSKGLD